MKKIIMVSLLLLSSLFCVHADTADVIIGGKNIGTIDYSYSIQTTSRGGCFITVTLRNNTDEFLAGTVMPTGTESSCSTHFNLRPYGKQELTIGCNEVPDGVKLMYIHRD